MFYRITYYILTACLVLITGCSSTLAPSSIQFDEVYNGPKEVTFAYGNWIINTPETSGISPESEIKLNEILMDRSTKIIGTKTMSAGAAQNTGLIPKDVADDSPKMMASLCDESFNYLLHVKIIGNEGTGGGVAYGGFDRDNFASAELTVLTIPDGVEVFHYFVRATEVSGSDDDFEESNGGEIIFGKNNEKIQQNALKNALNALKRKSNLPLEAPQ